jgi:nitrite reductase/ring-hydroxylating ferredoxin subunit
MYHNSRHNYTQLYTNILHIHTNDAYIQVHAYHNVCRHKAGPLQWDGTSGACELHGLRCKYHGWAYSLEGKLVGVPGFTDTNTDTETDAGAKSGRLDRTDLHLWPMRVARWRGLLFLQALPTDTGASMSGPSADLQFLEENAAFCERLSGLGKGGEGGGGGEGGMGGMGDLGGGGGGGGGGGSSGGSSGGSGIGSASSGVPLEEFEFHSASTHTLKCNWKVRHTHIHIHTYIHTYTHIHTHTYINTHTCTYIGVRGELPRGLPHHHHPPLSQPTSRHEAVRSECAQRLRGARESPPAWQVSN